MDKLIQEFRNLRRLNYSFKEIIALLETAESEFSTVLPCPRCGAKEDNLSIEWRWEEYLAHKDFDPEPTIKLMPIAYCLTCKRDFINQDAKMYVFGGLMNPNDLIKEIKGVWNYRNFAGDWSKISDFIKVKIEQCKGGSRYGFRSGI